VRRGSARAQAARQRDRANVARLAVVGVGACFMFARVIRLLTAACVSAGEH